MSSVITDDILEHFVVEGTWDELPQRIVDRCQPLTLHDVQPVLYVAGMAAQRKDDSFERFGDVAKRVAAS